MKQRDGNALAIFGGRHETARDIIGRIMAARNLLRFSQSSLARLHVVVKHLRRRSHRRVGEAERVGVVLVAWRYAERIRFFREVDLMLGAVGKGTDANAWQPIFAF